MSYLLIALGLILIHGLFVTAEYAFIKASSGVRRSVVDRTHRQAGEHIWQNMEEYLQVCNLGKTLSLIGMGTCHGLVFHFIEAVPSHMILTVEWGQIALVFLIFVLAQIVIGFEIPKLLGITETDRCVLALSGFLRASRILLYPIVWMIKQLTNFVR